MQAREVALLPIENVFIWRALSKAAPVPQLDTRGWAWGYLFGILHEIVTTGAECTLVGLEAVHPSLLNLHWSGLDLAAYEQGEEWGYLLRYRLLEMLRVLQAFNSECQNGRSRRDEDVHQPVLADLARKLSEHYAEEGIEPEDWAGDVSKGIRVLSMAEYRAEVGEQAWRDQTWGEEEPPHFPWVHWDGESGVDVLTLDTELCYCE
jgi:hypothetical protein